MRWTNRWRRWGNNYPRRLTHRRAEIFSPFHRLFRQALTALSPAIFIAPPDIHQVTVATLADSTRFAAISNTCTSGCAASSSVIAVYFVSTFFN
ncbi:hypothetical protein ABW286_14725 [Erwinia papayae]|uniref:Uncharacterized protein n=1 Tax=Erwinia papayae TaxID=206499 RepID=A0ABV3N3V8_9GAMM